jgi:hypothetical protein
MHAAALAACGADDGIERGIPVNRNLRCDLQTVRDELGIVGYEPYF